MPLYYAGLNCSSLFSENNHIPVAINEFTEIPVPGVTGIEISWNYFLIWRDSELYITGKTVEDDVKQNTEMQILRIPEETLERCKSAAAGKESIVIVTNSNNIWQYRLYEKIWKKVSNFIFHNEISESEFVSKVIQGGCTVALTNLGRVFNIPTLVEMPKKTKFVDIACGFDHTVLLTERGEVFTMGMGTRGQLGHGDLEDCDNPTLVEALAGLKVTQISAAGWHSAVVTDEGDLYTWGWNTSGQLGTFNLSTKVTVTPTLINFKYNEDSNIERNITKVQCGNTFTICTMDDGSLWGCGSNKYGQLGQPPENCDDCQFFVKLEINIDLRNVIDFKCQEWGTVIITK